MDTLMQRDPLSVVFKFLQSDDLRSCAAVCRLWRDVSGAERRFRANQLAQEALRWVHANPGHLVLAGSMALWILDGKPTHWFPNDADLFSYGSPPPPSSAPEIFGMHLAERHISCDDCSYSYLCNANDVPVRDVHYNGPRPLIINHATAVGPLQMILSSYFPTATSVVDSFDVSCAMVGLVAPGVFIKGRQFSSPTFTAFYWQHPPRTREERILAAFQFTRTNNRAKKYIARGYAHSSDKPSTREQTRFAVLYSLTKCETFRSMLETGASVECSCASRNRRCHFAGAISGHKLPF